jgi:methyl-accepting chemotaxis protein
LPELKCGGLPGREDKKE